MDYDNYTVGGDVYAELKLKKIEIEATFNITYTDAYINSKNATHIRVRILLNYIYDTWNVKQGTHNSYEFLI